MSPDAPLRKLLYTASWATGASVVDIVAEHEAIRAESDISSYMSYLKTMGGGSESGNYPHESEQILLMHIRQGNREAGRKLLSQLFARIRIATGVNVDDFRARALELAVLLSRAALDGGAEPESVIGINYTALSQVQEATSVQEVSAWLLRISERFLSFVFEAQTAPHREVIVLARRYVRGHAAEKIGLTEVAQSVGLSPAYLSGLFKEEMGITFTAYLARVRVDSAKNMLKTGTTSLAQVAAETGFADQSHFSRVFKRNTGTSPARYRAGERISEDTHEDHK